MTGVQSVAGAPSFHQRCGQLVTLSSGWRTAARTHATQVGGIQIQEFTFWSNTASVTNTNAGVQSWVGDVLCSTVGQSDV